MRVMHVVGARPNFMKVAPVMSALERTGRVKQMLVHTGQHYDESLSKVLFDDLEIPAPDLNLEVGSGSHGVQTGRVMIALEPVIQEYAPDWVFTVGDVNSTVAAALVSAKLCIPVAHVEAGLRSGDRTMPEEINRIVTDRLSDALYTTEPSANENLIKEGVPEDRIHFTGNVMIDTLFRFRDRATALGVPETMGLTPGKYVLSTLHRPSNVDRPERFKRILESLVATGLENDCDIVTPLHPRTRSRVEEFGLSQLLNDIRVLPSLGYLEFLGLMTDAAAVVTDSGGIQEETTVLGVPCITLRQNTERPITLTEGTNILFTGDLADLPSAVREHMAGGQTPVMPALWDGAAADRIAAITLGL